MLHRLLVVVMVMSLGLGGVATAQEASPPAADAEGPVKVTGTLSASNFVAAIIYQSPTVTLMEASDQVPISRASYAEKSEQVIGFATSPLFTQAPGTYEVALPIVPTASPFAIAEGAEPQAGLKAFILVVGSNITNDSYLEGFEQLGMSSFLVDPVTGWFEQGSLLLHAADDQQQFPSAAGPDGLWFTADDELTTLEPGYTVVDLATDGTATFDRSTAPVMDTRESASVASPDYSDMSWVDAFNALIDRLAQRYSFTEERGIDWEAKRAEFGPQIQAAQNADDLTAYVGALYQLAASVQDAHVSIIPTTLDTRAAIQQYFGTLVANYSGTVGAIGTLVSDSETPTTGPGQTYLIAAVGDTGPAHDAGWTKGTEIVSINGQTIAERLAEIPPYLFGSSISTPEKALLLSSQGLLLFPAGETVTIEYILPGETEVKSADLVAGPYAVGIATPAPATTPAPLETSSYTDVDGYTVIKWADFEEDITERIAVLEAALLHQQSVPDSKGIILDLRGNSGGWAALYLTMASYFFNAEHPMNAHVFDKWSYDETSGGLVREYQADYLLSSPKPSLAYTGPLTILVDQACGSSCEFFSQSLQVQGRAEVIGQFATAGAGGNIDQAVMPGGVVFQYTVGQYTFAGTDELNLEAKGVQPDVRVPVTIDSAVAGASGQDVVLDFAIAYLNGGGSTATPEASPAATPAG